MHVPSGRQVDSMDEEIRNTALLPTAEPSQCIWDAPFYDIQTVHLLLSIFIPSGGLRCFSIPICYLKEVIARTFHKLMHITDKLLMRIIFTIAADNCDGQGSELPAKDTCF